MEDSKTNAYLIEYVQKTIAVLGTFSKEELKLSLTDLHKKQGCVLLFCNGKVLEVHFLLVSFF